MWHRCPSRLSRRRKCLSFWFGSGWNRRGRFCFCLRRDPLGSLQLPAPLLFFALHAEHTSRRDRKPANLALAQTSHHRRYMALVSLRRLSGLGVNIERYRPEQFLLRQGTFCGRRSRGRGRSRLTLRLRRQNLRQNLWSNSFRSRYIRSGYRLFGWLYLRSTGSRFLPRRWIFGGLCFEDLHIQDLFFSGGGSDFHRRTLVCPQLLRQTLGRMRQPDRRLDHFAQPPHSGEITLAEGIRLPGK